MMNRRIFFIIYIAISVGSLSLAFGIEQTWFGIGAVVFIGSLGWAGWINKQRGLSKWITNLFWVGIIFLVTIGAVINLNTLLLIAAVVGGLGAWDLIRFQKSLAHFIPSAEVLQLEKQHLRLLGITLLVGGTLAGVVAAVRIQISFSLALVLGIFLILALSGFIRYYLKLAGPFKPE